MAGPNPYTYLIGWSKLDTYYYGVRFAPKSHPSDLWVSYFTSSKKVKAFRKLYGEPDIIQVRKTFNDPVKARLWEANVLRIMKVVKSKRWLNQTDHNDKFYHEGPRGSFTIEHRKKLSTSRRSQKMSKEHMEKLHEGRRKSKNSEIHKQAVLKTWCGRKHTEEAKEKMSLAARKRQRKRNEKGQWI